MYPICLDIAGKLCVVIGGGLVAVRKVQGLLEAGGRVVVVSPVLCPELAALVEAGGCRWERRPYRQGDLAGACLAFAATDEPSVQEQVISEASQRGVPINVIDRPAACDFHVPATVRRGDLLLAVSTGGRSPALAARIRARLQEQYGTEYESLLELLGRLRPQIIEAAATPAQRRELFARLLEADLAGWIRTGRWDRIEGHLREVLGPGVELPFHHSDASS